MCLLSHSGERKWRQMTNLVILFFLLFITHVGILDKLLTQENKVMQFWTSRKKHLDQCLQYVMFEWYVLFSILSVSNYFNTQLPYTPTRTNAWKKRTPNHSHVCFFSLVTSMTFDTYFWASYICTRTYSTPLTFFFRFYPWPKQSLVRVWCRYVVTVSSTMEMKHFRVRCYMVACDSFDWTFTFLHVPLALFLWLCLVCRSYCDRVDTRGLSRDSYLILLVVAPHWNSNNFWDQEDWRGERRREKPQCFHIWCVRLFVYLCNKSELCTNRLTVPVGFFFFACTTDWLVSFPAL